MSGSKKHKSRGGSVKEGMAGLFGRISEAKEKAPPPMQPATLQISRVGEGKILPAKPQSTSPAKEDSAPPKDSPRKPAQPKRASSKEAPTVISTTYSIEDIYHKISTDTRPLNPSKVLALVRSIAEIGLISGITIDAKSVTLAGRHRRAACLLLAIQKKDRAIGWLELFGSEPNHNSAMVLEEAPDRGWKYFDPRAIPVRIYPFDSTAEPDIARRVQVTENELRHNYTLKELRSIVVSLFEAGYVFNPGGGRTKTGEKSLSKEIELIFGLSRPQVVRLVRRILEEEGTVEKQPEPVPAPIKKTYRAIERNLRLDEFTQDERLISVREKLEQGLEELRNIFPEINQSTRKSK